MKRFLKLPRFSFTRAMIEYAPETHGVYGMFEGEGIIYIGKAVDRMTIKTCLLLHQDGSFGDCTMKATACAWEITSWPSARETELLAAFFKAHNHDPRCQAATARAHS
jgi:hypothetical protein